MGQSLQDIAQRLKDSSKKVQLIYAFNGTGKTRLSREFKKLFVSENVEASTQKKIIYYNAFTEDLFYWDNDLQEDKKPKLKIQPNLFTHWLIKFLKYQDQDGNIINNFQHYVNNKLTPHFNAEYFKDEKDPKSKVEANSEVTFSLERGNEKQEKNLKISKGEESNFIWSIFYTLIQQIIAELNEKNDNRSTHEFDELEYIFIDDPVSSLDENHLIQLAVDLAQLIASSKSKKLKFVISTHNSLFYNVLYGELGLGSGNILRRYEDETFELEEKKGDSNQSLSYHLFLKNTLEQAINDQNGSIQKYHFTLLRNLYEKTASFLGYPRWSALLPKEENQKKYLYRIIQFNSHSSLSYETVAEPNTTEKEDIQTLLEHLVNNYNFWKQVE